jgi:hypothetical protein
MRKSEELMRPESCLNKARSSEMLFVLLGRDLAAPATIRAWIQQRLTLELNQPFDIQITEAIECANVMEAQSQIHQSNKRKEHK